MEAAYVLKRSRLRLEQVPLEVIRTARMFARIAHVAHSERTVTMESKCRNGDLSTAGQPHWQRSSPATSVHLTIGGAPWIIVFSLCTLLVSLSACANPSGVSAGNTPSPINTMMPTTSPSAQTTATSGGVTATILIQGKRWGFASDCGCGETGSGIIIDSSQWVRVATDGTGEVAGYWKTFDFTPPSGQTPPSSGIPAVAVTNGSQTTYVVPSDCATQDYTARATAYEELGNEMGAYRTATGNDAQFMFGPPPWLAYQATYDPAHIACSPTAGYQQATPFYYMISMPAQITVPFFKMSAVLAFRKQQAIAHTPANFGFEEINNMCGMPFVQGVSATVIEYRCNASGYYRWIWTPAIARSLAAQIAGKDLASARNILAAYPGADIYKWQGINIQLASGSTLPSDPSQIRFKIYDTVVVGVNNVQTTGTPQIVP